MAVTAAGLDGAVDHVDAHPVVGDLVVRVLPAVRLNVHRVLQDQGWMVSLIVMNWHEFR